jgi:hypothetical protein
LSFQSPIFFLTLNKRLNTSAIIARVIMGKWHDEAKSSQGRPAEVLARRKVDVCPGPSLEAAATQQKLPKDSPARAFLIATFRD